MHASPTRCATFRERLDESGESVSIGRNKPRDSSRDTLRTTGPGAGDRRGLRLFPHRPRPGRARLGGGGRLRPSWLADASAQSLVLSQAQSCSATGSRPFDDEADGLVASEGYVVLT